MTSSGSWMRSLGRWRVSLQERKAEFHSPGGSSMPGIGPLLKGTNPMTHLPDQKPARAAGLEINHGSKTDIFGPLVGKPVRVRKAKLSDVAALHRIINHYAEQQLMLPKTHLQLYENLRDYTVAVEDSANDLVLGCGALHLYWENLAEIRALAILPGTTAKGIGTLLVESLLREAREYMLEQVFVFTYVPRFFSRFGFIQVETRSMPLKVYNECFHCPKFNTCDELAMVLHL